MSAIEEFSKYFESGNDVPVERAIIPADLANRLIAEFEMLEDRITDMGYGAQDRGHWRDE